MKQIFLIVAISLIAFSVNSQNPTLVFFTELGERFIVYIDGNAQHQYPESNVKILDVSGVSHNVRIKFENGFIEEINKPINVEYGTESSYFIHKRQGRYDMSPKGQIPLSQATRTASGNSQAVVSFFGGVAVNTNVSSNQNTGGGNANVGMTISGNGGSLNMNVSVTDDNNQGNANVSVGVSNNGNTGVAVASSSGTKSNTSGNLGGGSGQLSGGVSNSGTSQGTKNNNTGTSQGSIKGDKLRGVKVKGNLSAQEQHTIEGGNNQASPGGNQNQNQNQSQIQNKPVLPGYNGKIGCNNPMNQASFNQALESVKSKNFSNAQLTVAKQIADANCLTVAQVKELIIIFDFEETKLEFAKYAYKHTCDIDNYYQVNDAFNFEGSITKLDEYIKSVK